MWMENILAFVPSLVEFARGKTSMHTRTLFLQNSHDLAPCIGLFWNCLLEMLPNSLLDVFQCKRFVTAQHVKFVDISFERNSKPSLLSF